MTDDQGVNKDVDNKDVDDVSGVETMGHEWDGIKELNNPLPRWWLWVFYACIIWAVWYWVVYPAWPTPSGHTKGIGGYTQFNELKKSQAEIFARQQSYLNRFEKASFEEILNDPELYAFAIAGGKSFFKDNCATCHGTGASGAKGYPNLNDDDWLWGGTLPDIKQTITYGVRADHEKTRVGRMPAFGRDEVLSTEEIESVADYILSFSGRSVDGASGDGKMIFKDQCSMCHGMDAKGLRAFGAPNLADAIWLYGEDREDIVKSISDGRGGVMPSWKSRLDKNTIKELSIYIHQLGGGE